MNVLYLEDNPADVDFTRRELARSAPDVSLDVVGTVAGALAQLNEIEAALARGEPARYDVLLLDMGLPDGNGMSVLAQLRQRALPLAAVILTGSGDEESVLAALRAGADDYQIKRYNYWPQLPATLRAALDHFRLYASRRSKPIRLLYVEPNSHDVHLTRLHLAEHAPFIHLQTVHSAPEALDFLTASGPELPVDAILLDYQLPGMNALELLKEILQVRKLDLPVLLVTGQGTEEIALRSLKLGAADYLVKSPGYLNRLPLAVESAYYHALADREHAALKRSELRIRSIMESNLMGMFFWNAAGNVVEANDAFLRIVGYTQEDVRAGRVRWTDLTPPEFRPLVEIGKGELAAKGACAPYEQEFFRKDGSRAPVLVGATAFPQQPGEGAGFVLDITERQRADQKIRDQLAELTRWQSVMINREERMQQLKAEVNSLLNRQGQPARYASQDTP